MSEKLLIAKYGEGLITYSEYQESQHKGKLYCPFCNPPVRVTYIITGFFRAWRDEGGHNCGKARDQIKFLEADWKGRKLTEICKNKEGEVEITIDINTLVYPKRKSTDNIEADRDLEIGKKEKDIFPIYKDRIEVFRDVVRSVYQMKCILEKNKQELLKSLKFKFKTDEGILSLNDVVMKMIELNPNIVGKSRFVIFRVNKSTLSNGVIYINAYSARGINFAAKLSYPYNKNPFKKFDDEYAIAYGRITYSEKFEKYFLTLTNDFQIRKLKEEVGTEFFDDIEFEEYDYKKFVETRGTGDFKSIKESKDFEKNESGVKINTVNKYNVNNTVKVEGHNNYAQKDDRINEIMRTHENGNLNKVKINHAEEQEQKSVDKKRDVAVVDLDVTANNNIILSVKKFFKNLFTK